YAAHHPRREFYVGWSSARAIIANKVAPSLLDRYLAASGFESQQHDGAEDPGRPDKLWQPVPGDHGAHGAFDARASEHSPFLALDTHRWLLWLAGAGAAAGGWALAARSRRPQQRLRELAA